MFSSFCAELLLGSEFSTFSTHYLINDTTPIIPDHFILDHFIV